jgi:hypothetical protein
MLETCNYLPRLQYYVNNSPSRRINVDRIWFHYRRESRLKSDERIIRPSSRFIRMSDGSPTLPKKAHEGATWGFHCPEPAICQTPTPEHHPGVEDIKAMVSDREKLYLLRITSPSSDDLHVADNSVFESLRNEFIPDDVESNSAEEERLRREHKKRADTAYDRYWESLIPFNQYRPGQYKEPEVICFTPIPFERIKLVKVIEDYYEPPKPIDPKLLDELWAPLP